jgi:hypothetical protein
VKLPAASVSTLEVWPVFLLVMVTLAPAMGTPVTDETLPAMVPVGFSWANN